MYRFSRYGLGASLLALWLLSCSLFAAPLSFEAAKTQAREQIYHDRNALGSLYCGCSWEWTGRSGGRPDLQACGYQIRAQPNRAQRIEWEHIVPASLFGQQRQCWQQGGRSNCKRTDPLFNRMEADLHNLTPTVGEVNADRSNYRFGVLPSAPRQHGRCDFKVDFKARVAEPRNAVKGQIARTYFYMHDHYDLQLAQQQQRLLMAWDKQFPVSEWEHLRNQRASTLMGHDNPFVTGTRYWTLHHRNQADGLKSVTVKPASKESAAHAGVRGNRRSQLYHLPRGCPGYRQIGENNRVEFGSEAEAMAKGFRKAGNCR